AIHDAFRVTDEELMTQLRIGRPRSRTNSGDLDSTRAYQLSAGCVGCVALIRGSRIYAANLGDCRAVLCCNGEFISMTVDHRPEGNEAERERLEQLGVEVSNDGYLHGRIGVSRAFGDWAWDAEEKCRGILCQPDVTEAEVTEETEFLLLACDGIFEKMTSKEAGQIVRRRLRSSPDAKSAAETLIKHASKRNGSDNLSAVVVLFKAPACEVERTAPRFRLSMPLEPDEAPTAPAES
ncbi:unnamed protein product, partial [Polarella glacialis]